MGASPLPVVKGRYVGGRHAKGARKPLAAHFKYIEHRPRGEGETREDRFLFTQECDHVERREAVEDVMSHTSRSVLYHKIIFSPGEHEQVDDFRAWIREQIHDLEERKGVRLHWYGVVHAHEREHTREPHVHVVLAGAGEDEQTGEQKTVRMDTDDYAFLREQGREHSNYEFAHELAQIVRDLEEHDPLGREHEGRAHEQPTYTYER